MPLNLNNETVESLAAKAADLFPGRALVTNEGLVIRRRHNSSGFDCGVGRGGFSTTRKNTATEVATAIMNESARLRHHASLGGTTSYDTADDAIAALRRGDVAPEGPNPTLKALRALGNKTDMPSYRTRAAKAREAIAKGNIIEAIRQVEAVIDHASDHGNMHDIDRAKEALTILRSNYDVDSSLPKLRYSKIEVVTVGNMHVVMRDGKPVTDPLPENEAHSRMRYLVREAGRDEAVAEINNEIEGIPNLVRTAEEAGEAA